MKDLTKFLVDVMQRRRVVVVVELLVLAVDR